MIFAERTMECLGYVKFLSYVNDLFIIKIVHVIRIFHALILNREHNKKAIMEAALLMELFKSTYSTFNFFLSPFLHLSLRIISK